jgi:hypothetical protein
LGYFEELGRVSFDLFGLQGGNVNRLGRRLHSEAQFELLKLFEGARKQGTFARFALILLGILHHKALQFNRIMVRLTVSHLLYHNEERKG